MSAVSNLSNRRFLYSLFLLGFFAIFSTTISKNPVLPLFSQALGAGDFVIGLIAAVSPLAGIIFSFPVGVFSDNIGRKKMLIASGLIFLCAPLLYLFISNPVWLIPVRFFHGTATAILGPVISAIIAERFYEKKGEMLGQYSSATLIGRTIAPLVGGFILSIFILSPGLISYRLVYLIAAIAAVPVLTLILMYRGEENNLPCASVTLSSFHRSFVQFFSDSKLRATASVDMATYFAFGSFETFFPLVLVSQNISLYLIGVIFASQTLVIAATKPVFGRIADRFDKRIQIAAGILILGFSTAAIPFASSFGMFLLVSSFVGLGISLSSVATSSYIADVTKKERMGASMGALSSVMDIGHSAGPLVTGIVIAAGGFVYGFLFSLIIALAVCGFFILSVRN